jgi:hypothetical protein
LERGVLSVAIGTARAAGPDLVDMAVGYLMLGNG